MPRFARLAGRVYLVAVAVWVGATSGNARAQGANDASGADEVTVRGDRGGPRNTGGFVSTATVDDAPREITDAASLIEPLPGVHVRRLGADDSFSSLSIRGSTSTEVAILLAGVPLTGGADPSLDLATLPLWPGAKVRVYRSFAPGGRGPGSLGGTLVVDPPAPRAPTGSEVWAAAGSFGAARMRVADVRALGGEASGTRLVTALSASRADDAFTYFDPTLATPGYSTRENSGHAAANGLVSLTTPLRGGRLNDATLTFTTLLQARHQQVPGTVLAPTPAQMLDSNRELASLAVALPSALGRPGGEPGGEWGARAWVRRDQLALTDRLATPAQGPTHTNDQIAATGGALSWNGALDPALSVSAQVDGSEEIYAPGTWSGATTPPGATRTSLGGALDAEWHVTGAWSLTGSARGDAWNDTTGSAPSGSPSSHAEAHPTGHLGTEVRAGPIVLAAHGGAVERAPSFVERFGDRGEFIGNPGLLPESAWTVDAGGRIASKTSAPVRGRAEVALFSTWATDLIVFVPQGAYGQAIATNIGQARMLGVEIEAAANAFGFDLRVAFTGMATENDSACAEASGAIGASTVCNRPQLPGRPADDLVADLAYTLGPVRARWGVDAVSGMIADSVGAVVVPPRVLNSAGLRLQVPGGRGVRLALDVRNVFDVRTATYAGAFGPVVEPIGDAYEYPLPGRSFLATVRFAPDGSP
jgi:outer membrane cobalamin receptor